MGPKSDVNCSRFEGSAILEGSHPGMPMPTEDLKQRRCKPCEGGTPPLSETESISLLKQLSGWTFTSDKKSLTKSYRMTDFMPALAFMQKIAARAEREDHHADLHLTAYRNL